MSIFERALSLELSRGKFEDTPAGGLIVHDVPALAEGTWTDSAVGTPLFYPAKSLEASALNWRDTAVWSRHLGGVPRPITDKVGIVKNQHYDQSARAVVVDVHLHGLTGQSRDVIAMVKAGEAQYVSVEHGGEEAYNHESKQMEAKSIVFTGMAVVNKGACGKCRLNESDTSTEGMELDTKELEAKYTEQGVELASVKKELEALKAVKSVPMSDFEKVQKELSEALARVKKIEDTPLPTATTVAPTRSLEAPEFVVVHRNGEVYGAGDE